MNSDLQLYLTEFLDTKTIINYFNTCRDLYCLLFLVRFKTRYKAANVYNFPYCASFINIYVDNNDLTKISSHFLNIRKMYFGIDFDQTIKKGDIPNTVLKKYM